MKGQNCADTVGFLNSTHLPLLLEKDKPKDMKDLSEEAIIALRQNFSQPGKLILI